MLTAVRSIASVVHDGCRHDVPRAAPTGRAEGRRVSLPVISALRSDPRDAEPATETPCAVEAPRSCPSLKTLVKIARQCRNAEEFGELLRRKFDRQQRGEDGDNIERELDEMELRLTVL